MTLGMWALSWPGRTSDPGNHHPNTPRRCWAWWDATASACSCCGRCAARPAPSRAAPGSCAGCQCRSLPVPAPLAAGASTARCRCQHRSLPMPVPIAAPAREPLGATSSHARLSTALRPSLLCTPCLLHPTLPSPCPSFLPRFQPPVCSRFLPLPPRIRPCCRRRWSSPSSWASPTPAPSRSPGAWEPPGSSPEKRAQLARIG